MEYEQIPDKPVRYILDDGREQTEHLPWRFPERFSKLIVKWLQYKDRKGSDLYYYEVRLTHTNPIERKFSDLWFLDHTTRDHDEDNPLLWHERLLLLWIRRMYGADTAWFSSIDRTKITPEQYERIWAYGFRYYPTKFNSNMRLIYHGCSISDYVQALDTQDIMLKEEHERIEVEHIIEDKVTWVVSHNGLTINVSMDVNVHPLTTERVVLIVPGVDGSVDGYRDKYRRMAELAVIKGYGVVCISNYFITSLNWEDNIREALKYIEANAMKHFKNSNVSVAIIGHSAGASVASSIAWEYPNIDQLILINMAIKLKHEGIVKGLERYKRKGHIIYGSEDPSVGFIEQIPSRYEVTVVDGADHYFSDEYLSKFIQLANLLDD